jgi:NAD(P)-dependent dehydrogenase (short-subunit alcohol dehydrogenase family)
MSIGKLTGKSAIIFGGGGGIGGTAARIFAREGADITIADLNADGEILCEEIRGAGGNAVFVRTDITAAPAVEAAVRAAAARFGRIDTLYNCAGGSSLADGLIETVGDEEFWRTIRVDLYGTWLACKYAIPAIAASGGGSIINMSSAAAVRATMGVNAYAAAKGGVSALTRSLALGYAPKNIRVNAIAPGAVATPRVLAMLEASEAVRANVFGKQHLGLAEPEHIAALALHLASDDARTITGQVISVDGGLTM